MLLFPLFAMHIGATWVVIALFWSALGAAEQIPLLSEGSSDCQLDRSQRSPISLSNTWHILGPFKTGTRETAWGTDPLDSYGGFRNISYDPDAVFASALPRGGLVHWSTLTVEEEITPEGHAKAALRVDFPDVDWSFLRSIYGWAVLQYQAWARGKLTVCSDKATTISITTLGLLEIWIDGKPYFGGDFYSYRRAPLLLTLEPGQHVVELRLVRDVRAMGGTDEPRIHATLEVNQTRQGLIMDSGSILTAELVEGRLASSLASVNLQNPLNTSVDVVSIRSPDPQGPDITLQSGSLTIAPSQIRPAVFRIESLRPGSTRFLFEIEYKLRNGTRLRRTQPATVHLQERSMSEAQKFTFLHPSGIVSYAVLRPPINKECSSPKGPRLPVLLGLHGAGLEADGALVRHMLDGAYGICAWILFPSGVTSWSGDDWHTWGLMDVRAAIASIPDWMENVGFVGPGASLDDWIVSGHSNGGQGTWHLLSHEPDKVIAAAPVSGYSSIENYVPYTLWQNREPSLSNVLDISRRSFKHEMLVANFAGIPIHQQHGSDDDNVPAYHSRLMHQLIREEGWHSTYDELTDKGHWFDGVLTTKPLVQFYHQHAGHLGADILPLEFSVVVPTTADMGSRGGLFVDQLQSPDRYGHIHIVRDVETGIWSLEMRNIHRFHLIPSAIRGPLPQGLRIDGDDEPFIIHYETAGSSWFVQTASGNWKMTRDESWRCLSQRYGRQVGGMDAILRTAGPFMIVSSSPATDDVASQVSRNLLQYYSADSQLLTTAFMDSTSWSNAFTASRGNIITVALGGQIPLSQLEAFPMRLEGTRLVVSRPGKGVDHSYYYDFEPRLGAIFLRPLPDERLELIVWGVDLAGLQRAARLVPTLAGVGQPDFVVICSNCRWRGRDDVYAAGFFDYSWQISSASYIS